MKCFGVNEVKRVAFNTSALKLGAAWETLRQMDLNTN